MQCGSPLPIPEQRSVHTLALMVLGFRERVAAIFQTQNQSH